MASKTEARQTYINTLQSYVMCKKYSTAVKWEEIVLFLGNLMSLFK